MAMSNTAIFFVAVGDETYARWQNEITHLKPRKRKNWKDVLTDKRGQRTKVIYKDGGFHNWSTIYSRWSEVWPETKVSSELRNNAHVSSTAISPFGRIYCKIMHSELTDEAKSRLCRTLMRETVKLNHTGNHAGRSNLNKGKSAVSRTPNLQEKRVGK